MKESEQFINYTRGPWIISNEFYTIDETLRTEFIKRLTNDEKYIDCPKFFGICSIDQTKIFKRKFLSTHKQTENENYAMEPNPEEIELDL